jgi:hypothetical protein
VATAVALTYQIRVRGVLPPAAVLGFDRRTADGEPVETYLHGPLPDQAALSALLFRLEELGVQVVEIRRLLTGDQVSDDRSKAFGAPR